MEISLCIIISVLLHTDTMPPIVPHYIHKNVSLIFQAPLALYADISLPGGEDIIVAVIDTGLDYNHPDIQANVWTNPEEIPDDDIDDDDYVHISQYPLWLQT